MAHDDRTHVNRHEQNSALVHAKDVDDFKIPEGQPDPRGWSVKTTDGTTLGKVEDLLFDTGESRVRYLEVKADGDVSKRGGRDWFLLPIGTARLDDDNDDVVVNMQAADLAGVPAYERGAMSREYETSLRDYVRERPGMPRSTTSSSASGTVGSAAMGSARTSDRVSDRVSDREVNFYNSPEYDDAAFFSRGRGRGHHISGATDRDTSRGLGDRIADGIDDVKDRFDGNPASRPGPDATDRRY